MSAEQRRWLAGLYEANFAAVFRRCGVLLKSAEDAADAAHEVFLIAVNSLAPKTEEKRARAWLLTVAHNHCLDILRRRKRFGRALVVLGANDAGDDLESGVVDRDFVDQVLRQLSARERLALWQSAVERRSLADIAIGLQLSYAAAAQVVHRARQHAVRLAASVAAVIAVLRFPRAVRRLLARFRLTDAEPMLAAQRVLALAALPVVAAVALQSSTATQTSPGGKPLVVTSTASANSAADLAPGSVAGLLAPLTGGDRPGDTSIFSAPAAIPPMASSTVKTLTDRIQQSIGRLVPGAAVQGGPIASPSGSVTVPVIPGVPAVPSVPPAPSVPPGPSLPPPGP